MLFGKSQFSANAARQGDKTFCELFSGFGTISKTKKSNSTDSVGVLSRLKYLFLLVRMNAQRTPPTAEQVVAGITHAASTYETYSGKSASASSLLEIGFGARPHRAFAFQALVDNVTAVDLDVPVFGLGDFAACLKTNGFYRALKGVIRATLFDRSEWRRFHEEMREILPSYDPASTKLVVSDAGSPEFWSNHPGPYDFVYSTDVFEHIPRDILAQVLSQLHNHLSPNGVVVTRPTIFTGIIGGHDPNWYRTRVDANNSETAWQHLWDPDFAVDTYLNRLTRSDYERMFHEAGFKILSEEAVHGRLGEKHLTQSIKQRLNDRFDDHELFSNTVEYVLCRNDANLA